MDPEESPLVDLSPYWDVDDAEYDYCDCPGPPPPPQFMIPPPPPPPTLQLCQGGGEDLQYCHLEPVGAEYTQTAFPSLPIIAVCSSVVLVAILVASFLLWKHKKKVQNFLPCKNEHQGHCDIASSNGVTYDDVLLNHHPTRLPQHVPESQTLTPIELLDVKYGNFGATHQMGQLRHGNFPFPQKENTVRSTKGKEHFNPIYEEVSGGSEDKGDTKSYDSDIEDSEVEARTIASEDEFAEDELSLAEYPREGSRPCSGTSSVQGSTGGDLCRDAGSGFSDGAASEEGSSERRAMKSLLRAKENCNTGRGSKKHTHSLERNKDGHPSDGFHAKQNYYMGKTMLGPDLAYPDIASGNNLCPQRDPSVSVDVKDIELKSPNTSTHAASPSEPTPYAQSGGWGATAAPPLNETHINVPALNVYHAGAIMSSHLPSDSPPPPPYTPARHPAGGRETIPAVYNPHVPPSLKAPRMPGVVLSELNQKLSTNGGPRPSHVYTVGPEDPYPSPSHGMGSVRGRGEGASDFSTFHHPHKPVSPQDENIYSTIDEDGTTDAPMAPSNATSRKYIESKQVYGRQSAIGERPPVPKDSKVKGQSQNIPNQRSLDDDNGQYGDIRPSFSTRTPCT